jgi:hypothetical protein
MNYIKYNYSSVTTTGSQRFMRIQENRRLYVLLLHPSIYKVGGTIIALLVGLVTAVLIYALLLFEVFLWDESSRLCGLGLNLMIVSAIAFMIKIHYRRRIKSDFRYRRSYVKEPPRHSLSDCCWTRWKANRLLLLRL